MWSLVTTAVPPPSPHFPNGWASWCIQFRSLSLVKTREKGEKPARNVICHTLPGVAHSFTYLLDSHFWKRGRDRIWKKKKKKRCFGTLPGRVINRCFRVTTTLSWFSPLFPKCTIKHQDFCTKTFVKLPSISISTHVNFIPSLYKTLLLETLLLVAYLSI